MDPVQKRLMFEDEWVAAATFFLFFLFLFIENTSFVFFFFVLERFCRRRRLRRRRRRIFYIRNQCVIGSDAIGYVKKIIAWIISTVLFSFSFLRKGLLLLFFFINNNVY
jgi:uncharacterized membrane protein